MKDPNKPKPKVKIDHLINWFFGNYCAKCEKVDLESEEYGKKCLRKINEIKNNLDISEMTHKEFLNIIRNSSFCHPSTRKFSECESCKKIGLNDNYWRKNWDGWNFNKKPEK